MEQRQENAAALKLKSERVGGMSETQVGHLRNAIKVLTLHVDLIRNNYDFFPIKSEKRPIMVVKIT